MNFRKFLKNLFLDKETANKDIESIKLVAGVLIADRGEILSDKTKEATVSLEDIYNKNNFNNVEKIKKRIIEILNFFYEQVKETEKPTELKKQKKFLKKVFDVTTDKQLIEILVKIKEIISKKITKNMAKINEARAVI
jgi:hypothetical protein